MILQNISARRLGRAVLTGMLGGVSVVALGAGSSAWAQGEGVRDVITVTAQFREQRLQDTPIAITAVTGEEIVNKGLNSVVDIAATAPNVNLAQGSGAYGAGIAAYIRGIGQYDTNFVYEPGVGMYVDDVYHGAVVGSMFDLLDLQRVEVLRGPQGTLAGRNSIGGAIKLYSIEAEGSGDGYLQATYGELDRMEVRGAYDIGLAENLFFRVSGFGKRRDGYVDLIDYACAFPGMAGTLPTQNSSLDSCKVGETGQIKAMGLRGALRYVPNEDVEIKIIGSIVRDDSGGVPTVMTNIIPGMPPDMQYGITYDEKFLANGENINYENGVAPGGFLVPPQTKVHSESISGHLDWRLTDTLQLTSITSYANYDTAWAGSGDGSPLELAGTLNKSPYHQFTQELRLNGEFGDGLLEWTIGGFYFDSKGNVAARVASLGFTQDDPVNSTSKAVYGHAIFHPVPEMSISGGIRYTDDKKDYEFFRRDPADTSVIAPFPFGAFDGQTAEATADSVDYRAGVDYRFSEALMAYASFSTGYKGNGINPRPFTVPQIQPFGPETVNAYEIGFKSDLADGRLRLNVAAFLSKYKDIILIDANGFPGGPGDPDFFPFSAAPFNAGDADIKGVEVETAFEPAPGLVIEGSGSYLDFEYTRLDDNALASGYDTGFITPFTPEWKGSGSISYEGSLPGGATLTPRFYIDYQSGVYSDPANSMVNYLEGRAVLNANLAYVSEDGDWQAIVGVTNLTDKRYFTNRFDLENVNGRTNGVVGRPREWFITVRRNF